jgi:hypothetical protein
MTTSLKAGSELSQKEKARLNWSRKFKGWLIFQAIIPYMAVIACWPMACFNKVPFAFQKTFIGADLLLIGALLLTGIVVEIWSEQRHKPELSKAGSLDSYFFYTLLLAISLLFVFGFIKSASLGIEFPDTNTNIGPDLDWTVLVCVWSCILGGLCALIWSIFITARMHRCFLDAEVKSLKG